MWLSQTNLRSLLKLFCRTADVLVGPLGKNSSSLSTGWADEDVRGLAEELDYYWAFDNRRGIISLQFHRASASLRFGAQLEVLVVTTQALLPDRGRPRRPTR
jgi:hypothetical protein